MSWIIRHRETGKPELETWTPPERWAPILKPEFEIVTAHQHLVDVNTPGTPAHAWARRPNQ